MAFVAGKAEAAKRLGDATRAATLPAVFAHKEENSRAAGGVVDGALAHERSLGAIPNVYDDRLVLLEAVG